MSGVFTGGPFDVPELNVDDEGCGTFEWERLRESEIRLGGVGIYFARPPAQLVVASVGELGDCVKILEGDGGTTSNGVLGILFPPFGNPDGAVTTINVVVLVEVRMGGDSRRGFGDEVCTCWNGG